MTTIDIPLKDRGQLIDTRPELHEAVLDAFDHACDETAKVIIKVVDLWSTHGMDGFGDDMATAADRAVERLSCRVVNGVDAYDFVQQFTVDFRGPTSRGGEVCTQAMENIDEAVVNFAFMHCGRPKECGEGCPAYTVIKVQTD